MFEKAKAFSGFSVNDLDRARAFYGDTLGLDVADGGMGTLMLLITGGCRILIYPKPDHEPASFTILNFPVDDIDRTIDELVERGVRFERYNQGEIKTDAKGILAHDGMKIAWFKDPAGNVLSVIQEPA